MSSRWTEVWEDRRLDPARGSLLTQLLVANGYDTGYGDVTEESWRAHVKAVAARLRLTPGDSAFEVGCGAGAFLLPLAEMGIDVAGIDLSRALVDCARSAFPDGDFAQADANEMALEPKADAVVANGVFLYFESLEYAAAVLARMAARATRAVAVLDVPDAARRDEALAYRQELVGGREAYEKRYEGLEHLSYDRDWFAQQMHDLGLRDVRVEDQRVAGYANARFRFNAWGFR